MTETAIWEEAPGGQYIIYTEDPKLIRQIEGWGAFRDSRIRVMAESYQIGKSRVTAIQYRFKRGLYKRLKAAVEAKQK